MGFDPASFRSQVIEAPYRAQRIDLDSEILIALEEPGRDAELLGTVGVDVSDPFAGAGSTHRVNAHVGRVSVVYVEDGLFRTRRRNAVFRRIGAARFGARRYRADWHRQQCGQCGHENLLSRHLSTIPVK